MLALAFKPNLAGDDDWPPLPAEDGLALVGADLEVAAVGAGEDRPLGESSLARRLDESIGAPEGVRP
jgi:hypothetical protein